jgi:hypothetical protein
MKNQGKMSCFKTAPAPYAHLVPFSYTFLFQTHRFTEGAYFDFRFQISKPDTLTVRALKSEI